MGIYDRDYYRDDSDGWWSNLDGRWVTVRLIAILAVVFLFQLFTRDNGDPVLRWGLYSIPDILDGQVWRLLTGFFLHPLNLFHLAFDLYFLYWAGSTVEGIYGRKEYLGFLLASTGLASLMCLLAGILNGGHGAFLGGPVLSSTVLVLFACHFPMQRIYILFVLPVPVWLIAVGTVGMNMLLAMGPVSNLAPVAVLSAAIFALVYYQTQMRVTNFFQFSIGSSRARPKLRVYSESEEPEIPVSASASAVSRSGSSEISRGRSGVDEQLEAKLDQVLEKVAREGKQSLTPEENAILLRASEIYKRRRS